MPPGARQSRPSHWPRFPGKIFRDHWDGVEVRKTK
jgi:hypothetical protein